MLIPAGIRLTGVCVLFMTTLLLNYQVLMSAVKSNPDGMF